MMYRWLRNGVHLGVTDDTDTLTFDYFSKSQEGRYQCQIKSPAGWTRLNYAKATTVSIGKVTTFFS